MGLSIRRSLSVLLCVAQLFPGYSAWADALPTPAVSSQPPAPAPRNVEVDSDLPDPRAKLIETFHQASWAMGQAVKSQSPLFYRLVQTTKQSNFASVLAPYAHCPTPFRENIVTLAEIDRQILIPLQEAFVQYLVSREEEILHATVDPLKRSSGTRRRELVSKTGAQCPLVSGLSEIASLDESADILNGNMDDLPGWMRYLTAQKNAAQKPFFEYLETIQLGAPPSRAELRNFVSWLSLLRDFRDGLAQVYAEKGESSFPAPALKLSLPLGKYLRGIFSELKTAHVENASAGKTAEVSPQAEAALQASRLPRFEICKDDRKQMCFVDATPTPDQKLKDSLGAELAARPETPGRDYDLFRKTAIETTLYHRTAAEAMAGKSIAEIPAACRNAPDLNALMNFADETRRQMPRTVWLEFLSGRAESLQLPSILELVKPPSFIEMEKKATAFFERYSKEYAYQVPGARFTVRSPKIENVKKALKEETFTEWVSTSRPEGNEWVKTLKQNLRMWVLVGQDQIWPIENAVPDITAFPEMLQSVLEATWMEVFTHYLRAVAKVAQLDGAGVDLLISEGALEPYSPREFQALSRTLTKHFSEVELGTSVMEALADKELERYVENLTPFAEMATRAEETARFLDYLAQWKDGVTANLVPTPASYAWSLANIQDGPRKTKVGPRFMDLPGPSGKTLGSAMPFPDVLTTRGYDHVKPGLVKAVYRTRKKIVEAWKARGFTDQQIRNQFGIKGARDLETLAELVLQRIILILRDPTYKNGPLIQEMRAKRISEFLKWLTSKKARADYEKQLPAVALRLWDGFLSGVVIGKQTPEEVAKALEPVWKELQKKAPIQEKADLKKVAEVIFEAANPKVLQAGAGLEIGKARENLRKSKLLMSQEEFKKGCEGDKLKCLIELNGVVGAVLRVDEAQYVRRVAITFENIAQFIEAEEKKYADAMAAAPKPKPGAPDKAPKEKAGPPPAPPPKPVFLSDVLVEEVRAATWGEGFQKAEKEEQAKKVRKWFEGIGTPKSPGVAKRSEQLVSEWKKEFPVWSGRIQSRWAKVTKDLREITRPPVKFIAPLINALRASAWEQTYKEVLDLVQEEPQRFVDSRGTLARREQLGQKLAEVVLWDFDRFTREMQRAQATLLRTVPRPSDPDQLFLQRWQIPMRFYFANVEKWKAATELTSEKLWEESTERWLRWSFLNDEYEVEGTTLALSNEQVLADLNKLRVETFNAVLKAPLKSIPAGFAFTPSEPFRPVFKFGEPGKNAKLWSTWLTNQKKDYEKLGPALVQGVWKSLKKKRPTLIDGKMVIPKNDDIDHLWDAFPNFEAFLKSPARARVATALEGIDAHLRAVPGKEHFMDALVALHSFTNVTADNVDLDGVRARHRHSPRYESLGYFASDALAVIGFSLRSAGAAEGFMNSDDEPEDWAAIAHEAYRNSAEVARLRVLAAKVPATRVESAYGKDHNYHPMALLKESELKQLAPNLTYWAWRARLEEPSNRAPSRPNDRTEHPLHDELTLSHTEFSGNMNGKDISVRNRFKSRMGKWDTVVYGATEVPVDRVENFKVILASKKVEMTNAQITSLDQAINALADFTSMMNEIVSDEPQNRAHTVTGSWNDVWSGVPVAEVQKALDRFARIWGMRAPDLTSGGYGYERNWDLATRANFAAMAIANQRVFGKTDDPKRRQDLEIAVDTIVKHNRLEAKKAKLRSRFADLVKNQDIQLTKLCSAGWVKDIQNEEKFKEMEQFIVDNNLLFYDGTFEQVFGSKGWLPQSSAKKLTADLMKTMADQKASQKNFENGVQIILLASFLGTLGQSLWGSAAKETFKWFSWQGAIKALGYLGGAGFATLEGIDLYRDFSSRPHEISVLYGVRDTVILQRKGESPLMSDSMASQVPGMERMLEADQRSLWKWTMHAMGALSAAQTLSSTARGAKGGYLGFMDWKNPQAAVMRRLRPAAEVLGVEAEQSLVNGILETASMSTGASASKTAAEIREVAPQAVGQRVAQKFAETVDGTLKPNGKIALKPSVKVELSDGAKSDSRWWGKAAGAHPDTLKPRAGAPVISAEALGRAQFLKDLAESILRTGEVSPRDLFTWMALNPAVEPMHMYRIFAWLDVPLSKLLWRLSSRNHRMLVNLYRLSHTYTDILALRDPQTMQWVGYLNWLNLGGRPFEFWELLSRSRVKPLLNIPKSLRPSFESLWKDAEALAAKMLADEIKISEKTFSGRISISAMTEVERQAFKARAIRDIFADAVTQSTLFPERIPLIEKYAALLNQPEKAKTGWKFLSYFSKEPGKQKLAAKAIKYYAEVFLAEKGIGVSEPSRVTISKLQSIAEWQILTEARVREFAKKNGVKEEEVIYWMLHPSHPNHALLKKDAPLLGSVPGDMGVIGDAEHGGADWLKNTHWKGLENKDLSEWGERLRDLFNEKQILQMDLDFLKAVSEANYPILATRLLKIYEPTKDAAGVDASAPEPSDDFDKKPEPEPLYKPGERGPDPVRVVRPAEPLPVERDPWVIPEMITRDRPAHDLSGMDQVIRRAVNGSADGGVKFVPEAERTYFVEIMLQRRSSHEVAQALGRLRGHGVKDRNLLQAFEKAYFQTRIWEISEGGPPLRGKSRDAFFDYVESLYHGHRMSLAEAETCLSFGGSSEFTAEAQAVVEKAKGLSSNPTDLERLALVLDVPPQLFFSKQAGKYFGGPSTPEARMIRQLWNTAPFESVEEAALVLRNPADLKEARAHAESLKQNLTRLAETLKDETALAVAKRLCERTDQALYVFENPHKFAGAKKGKFEWANVDLSQDLYFTLASKPRPIPSELSGARLELEQLRLGEQQSAIAGILKAGVADFRMKLVETQFGKGFLRYNSKEVLITEAERMARKAHVAILRQSALRAGVVSEASLPKFTLYLNADYVELGHIEFPYLQTEYKHFLDLFQKRYGLSFNLNNPDDLGRFLKWVENEKFLLKSGVAKISSKEMAESVEHAVKAYEFAPQMSSMRDPFTRELSERGRTLEEAIFFAHSNLPLETIALLTQRSLKASPAEAAEIRKWIYFLTDGPTVRWTPEGTHTLGDTVWYLFGAGEGSSIDRQFLKYWQKDIQARFSWAHRMEDERLIDAFQRGADRSSSY